MITNFKIFENYQSDDIIKIYHSTEHADDAESMLKNGFNIYKGRGRGLAEGNGMGAFFEPHSLHRAYGKYCVEFDITKDDFKKYILIDDRNDDKEICYFTEEIYGYNKSFEDQLKDISNENYTKITKYFYDHPEEIIDYSFLGNYNNIKGYVTINRFPGMLSIHLFDSSIAKPIRIIE